MRINVYESHLMMLHQWWARIERYLETASAGSKNIQALSLMKVTVALHVRLSFFDFVFVVFVLCCFLFLLFYDFFGISFFHYNYFIQKTLKMNEFRWWETT